MWHQKTSWGLQKIMAALEIWRAQSVEYVGFQPVFSCFNPIRNIKEYIFAIWDENSVIKLIISYASNLLAFAFLSPNTIK